MFFYSMQFMCDKVGELTCNTTAVETQGIIVSKCDHSCCVTDKCNAPDSVTVNLTVGTTTQSAPTTMSSETTSAHLITTFLSLAVIFALIIIV